MPNENSKPQQHDVDQPSGLILITGHPRSGTHFTAKLLRSMGYPASIEGRWMTRRTRFVSSWKHAQPGKFRNLFYARDMRQDFDKIIHQVRHPLDVVASSNTLVDRTVDHMKKYLDIPESAIHHDQPVALCMRTWIGWNKLIEPRAEWRFRLEDFEDAFPEFCRRLGLPEQPWPDIGKKNTRKHGDLTWNDLDAVDKNLADQARELAQRYGYTDV